MTFALYQDVASVLTAPHRAIILHQDLLDQRQSARQACREGLLLSISRDSGRLYCFMKTMLPADHPFARDGVLLTEKDARSNLRIVGQEMLELSRFARGIELFDIIGGLSRFVRYVACYSYQNSFYQTLILNGLNSQLP
jgi:hypothetical protein